MELGPPPPPVIPATGDGVEVLEDMSSYRSYADKDGSSPTMVTWLSLSDSTKLPTASLMSGRFGEPPTDALLADEPGPRGEKARAKVGPATASGGQRLARF